jgi:hypothetical protein
MLGQRLYQMRARQALPILIRQAASQKPIYYADLAAELDMPNPRNLNFVLGSVGATVNQLSATYRRLGEIPQIQSLVINQTTKLPGSGFEGFLAEIAPNYSKLTFAEKRAYLDHYWQGIFAYPYWDDVLSILGLGKLSGSALMAIEEAKRGLGTGGEGPEHLALKNFVQSNPTCVGFFSDIDGIVEAQLPSGDSIDVLFEGRGRLLGVEVKSSISNSADLARGLFQCVKYRAVMKAEQAFKGQKLDIDALLVVGRDFPSDLNPLRNSLGVKVVKVIR